MIQRMLTEFAIKRPKLVMMLGFVITLGFLAAFPSLRTDTDPVHMLPVDNESVLRYEEIKDEFNISDMVALGIKTKDGSSLFTADGMAKVYHITEEILKIKDEPKPETKFSRFFKKLQFLKDHSEESKKSRDILVKEDLISVSTVDDIVLNENGELLVQPLMAKPPATDEEAGKILDILNDNPMFGGKMVSEDGSVVAIFMPLQSGMKERSYYLGERVKLIAEKYLGDNEDYYFAGLPIAESTFGNEMFVQMGLYAPMAGLVIFLLMLFFFRSFKIVIAPMILGVMTVIWSMGSLIYSGNVIHIMSSMIPIFLLPIAVLNSIHILSKLSDKMNKFDNRPDVIRDVMKGLFLPMLYTSLTTIVGFASLATTGIPPVMVFGITIAFGVFLAWLLSMVFIPAYTMLLSENALKAFARQGEKKSIIVEFVHAFHNIAWKIPKTVIAFSMIVLIVSIFGIKQIIINDNPVRWFKKGHFLREADIAMNEKLAGTYMANLYFEVPEEVRKPAETPSTDSGDEFDEFAMEEETMNDVASIKDPQVIAYIDRVDSFLKTIEDEKGQKLVGGVTSIVDVLKKIGKVAISDPSVPDTREKVSQYIFLFESGDTKKGKDLRKIITPSDAPTAQTWIYFKSGDNQNMTKVITHMKHFMKENPVPEFKDAEGVSHPLIVKWSGLMKINNVWQDSMVKGMQQALLGSFVIVFFMMIFLFRSVKWAVIAMLPLTITIMFIYGLIGFTGKFYDMPIAVLSSLTLGLSVDFAIHFIEHALVFNRRNKDFKKTYDEIFEGTAQAIWRNVLVISIGFTPLFLAGLVPYLTVGSFFFLIMLVSGFTTLLLMPAILRQFYRWLPGFKEYV
jgi:predicted RND superfamily exporter protein